MFEGFFQSFTDLELRCSLASRMTTYLDNVKMRSVKIPNIIGIYETYNATRNSKSYVDLVEDERAYNKEMMEPAKKTAMDTLVYISECIQDIYKRIKVISTADKFQSQLSNIKIQAAIPALLLNNYVTSDMGNINNPWYTGQLIDQAGLYSNFFEEGRKDSIYNSLLTLVDIFEKNTTEIIQGLATPAELTEFYTPIIFSIQGFLKAKDDTDITTRDVKGFLKMNKNIAESQLDLVYIGDHNDATSSDDIRSILQVTLDSMLTSYMRANGSGGGGGGKRVIRKAAVATKKAMYEQARSLGIKDRSLMNKAELLRAINRTKRARRQKRSG